MEEHLLKVFAAVFVITVLFLLGLAGEKYDQGYEQGVQDKMEEIRENPKEYDMIYVYDVIDYIKSEYSLEDMIYFYEE